MKAGVEGVLERLRVVLRGGRLMKEPGVFLLAD